MKFKRRFLAAMSIVLFLIMFTACGNKEGELCRILAEQRLDLGGRIEAAVVHTGAAFRIGRPAFLRPHHLGPEGKEAALRGTDAVDGAPGLLGPIKNAVAVRAFDEAGAPPAQGDEAPPKGSLVHGEERADPFALGAGEKNGAGLAPAAAAAPDAGKTNAPLPPHGPHGRDDTRAGPSSESSSAETDSSRAARLPTIRS